MCRLNLYAILFFMVNFSAAAIAQSAEVKIEIPGKADFIYDGLRIQVESTNTLIGQYVGEEITSGLENTFLGKEAGKKTSLGSQNTYIGMLAGVNNEGSGNVFLGYKAGLQTESVSDQLYIANSETTKPLIYGDFRLGLVEINDNLNVSRDLYVNRNAIISTGLSVLGSTSLYSLNINSGVPTLNFFAPSQGSFQFTYHPSQDRFYLTDDDGDEVMEIKNGEVSLPQYGGSSGGNLIMDENGKLIKESSNRSKFNQFEFHQKDIYSNYTKLTRGVQFADGTVLSGIKALIKDNNTTGSTGVHNTAFVGIYRMNKYTGNSNTILPIYRIDANDTAMDTHELFTQTNLAQTGANVVDNDTYIYLIQIFYCDDCGVTEVEIME